MFHPQLGIVLGLQTRRSEVSVLLAIVKQAFSHLMVAKAS